MSQSLFQIYLFILEREIEKGGESEGEGQREREGHADSPLSAEPDMGQEPDVGLDPTTLRSRPELKPRISCLTD